MGNRCRIEKYQDIDQRGKVGNFVESKIHFLQLDVSRIHLKVHRPRAEQNFVAEPNMHFDSQAFLWQVFVHLGCKMYFEIVIENLNWRGRFRTMLPHMVLLADRMNLWD
jgi:hypothetical protein